MGFGRAGAPFKNGLAADEGSLDQYLREISRYPLITQDEEVALVVATASLEHLLMKMGTPAAASGPSCSSTCNAISESSSIASSRAGMAWVPS